MVGSIDLTTHAGARGMKVRSFWRSSGLSFSICTKKCCLVILLFLVFTVHKIIYEAIIVGRKENDLSAKVFQEVRICNRFNLIKFRKK